MGSRSSVASSSKKSSSPVSSSPTASSIESSTALSSMLSSSPSTTSSSATAASSVCNDRAADDRNDNLPSDLTTKLSNKHRTIANRLKNFMTVVAFRLLVRSGRICNRKSARERKIASFYRRIMWAWSTPCEILVGGWRNLFAVRCRQD